MSSIAKAAETGGAAEDLSYGKVKFFRDVAAILEMKLLFLRRGWTLYLIRPMVFPLAIFFWLRLLAPDDPDSARRIMTGAIIFGFSMSTANLLAQQIMIDWFAGRLKLLITMPMSKAAYAIGILGFAAVQSFPMVGLLLGLAAITDIDFQLNWTFFPMIFLVLFVMGGLTFIIVSLAPNQESGSIMANLAGVVLVVLSPVFFTMEQAPLPLEWLGWVSPMRYAADGIITSLNGRNDVWRELAVMCGFAAATISIGLWKLRWRQR
jgi:ABC-type multidrug transport system permease subunit